MTIASDLMQQHFRTMVDDNARWLTLIADDILWELVYAPSLGHPARLSPTYSGTQIQPLPLHGPDTSTCLTLNRKGGEKSSILAPLSLWPVGHVDMAMTFPSLGLLRILVVDDCGSIRDVLKKLLESCFASAVVAEAVDGFSAAEIAFSLAPQIIIMDVRMPRLGGIEATRRIKRFLPGTSVIGFSCQDDRPTEEAMIAAGASAFLSKTCAHRLPDVIAEITGTRRLENPSLS